MSTSNGSSTSSTPPTTTSNIVSSVKTESLQSTTTIRSTPPPPSSTSSPFLVGGSSCGSATASTPSSSVSKKPRYDSPKATTAGLVATQQTNGGGGGTSTNLLVQQQQQPQPQSRPLVALLDGRDCTVEMPILKEIATVAFCDAQSTSEIHEKVLNEAQAALLYSTITLNREDLIKFKALRLIVKIGADLENIDCRAAADLNIAVCNVGGCCVEEAADTTISLILSLYRRTHWLASQVEQKLKLNYQGNHHHHHQQQQQQSQFITATTPEQTREVAHGCVRIRGQWLGIVGLGKVGMAVAIRARVFGFNVCFYDPNVVDGIEKAIGGLVRCQSLVELMRQSDCISLHTPLTESTYHMINESALKHIKSSSTGGILLVNTAHANLIDEVALAMAIKSSTVRSVALDKFNPEWFNASGGILRDCMHVIMLTPSVGFYSESSMREMREQAAYEVRRGLLAVKSGTIMIQALKNCVNKDLLMNTSSSSLLGFSNGSLQSQQHLSHSAAALMLINNAENRSDLVGNRNISSSQLSSLGGINSSIVPSSGGGQQQVPAPPVVAPLNHASPVAASRSAGAGSPLINPLMAAAMAANNLAPNPLANLLTGASTGSTMAGGSTTSTGATNPNQLLAHLSSAAGSAPPAFDQISAAAALNGVSSSSINPVALLSYLTAAAATSSSPSPSPNTIVNPATSQGPTPNPPGSAIVPTQSTLAAFTNALMSADPLLQKSALIHQQQAAVAALLSGSAVATSGVRESTSPGGANTNTAATSENDASTSTN